MQRFVYITVRKKSSDLQKLFADLYQQNGYQAEISAGQHLRSPSLKPTRADCRHGEFFRDFWQAVYGERKGVRGGRRRGEMRGTTVCTAAGRWVRSVSTVRELDRASGPLVGPVPTRLCTYTDRHKRVRERAAASVHRHVSRMHFVRARARDRARVCSTRALARALRECACASDTLPVSQCVRQERCIALRCCVKASENTRSLGLFARLVPSFSRCRALRGPLFSPVEPLRHGSRSLFSVSVTPPKGPLPRASIPRSSCERSCTSTASPLPRKRSLR